MVLVSRTQFEKHAEQYENLMICCVNHLPSTYFQFVKANRRVSKPKQHLPHDFLVDQLFQLFLGEVVLVFVEIKELLWNWGSCRLVFGIMIWLKIWVLQSFVDSDALDGVESEQLLQQVKSQVRGLGEHALEWDLLLEWQRADVFSSTSRFDTVVVFHSGSTEDVEDEGKLVVI